MVRVAALVLLAISAVASARPLYRRQLTHDELVPRLIARDLGEFDLIPQLTVRELEDIIAQVSSKRTTTCDNTTTTASTAASSSSATSSASGSFKQLAYAQFQISSTPAGTAEQEAAAILDPFNGVDLASVSQADLDAVSTMRVEAENAETELYNPQIAAASGATAKGLQVGKIKNKVLKLTLEVFGIKAKIAQAQAAGKDTSADESSLTAETTKLNNNIATDKASAGQTSIAATGTPTDD